MSSEAASAAVFPPPSWERHRPRAKGGSDFSTYRADFTDALTVVTGAYEFPRHTGWESEAMRRSVHSGAPPMPPSGSGVEGSNGTQTEGALRLGDLHLGEEWEHGTFPLPADFDGTERGIFSRLHPARTAIPHRPAMEAEKSTLQRADFSREGVEKVALLGKSRGQMSMEVVAESAAELVLEKNDSSMFPGPHAENDFMTALGGGQASEVGTPLLKPAEGRRTYGLSGDATGLTSRRSISAVGEEGVCPFFGSPSEKTAGKVEGEAEVERRSWRIFLPFGGSGEIKGLDGAERTRTGSRISENPAADKSRPPDGSNPDEPAPGVSRLLGGKQSAENPILQVGGTGLRDRGFAEAESVPISRLPEKITLIIKSAPHGEKVRAHLKLIPESLGKVEIEVEWSGGIRIQLLMHNQEALAAVKEGLYQLREMLLAQGINLENLQLGMAPDGESAKGYDTAPEGDRYPASGRAIPESDKAEDPIVRGYRLLDLTV